MLVYFYADYRGLCRAISPMLEEIAEEVEGDFRVATLDIDDKGGTATKYSVQSIQTLILFQDGQPVERWVDIVPKETLLSGTRNHVSSVEATVESS